MLADGRSVVTRLWPGHGEPIVLLHGLLASSAAWDELCLATDRPCVAIDLPGFGASDPCAVPRVSAFADDVRATLDALGVERFALVGHSLGGAIAAAMVEPLAARVRALVMLAPAGFGRIALAEAVSLPGVRTITERALPFALSRRLPLTLAYRAVVANGLAPDSDEIDRVLARGAGLAPGVRDATRAVVHAGLSRQAFHRRRVAYDGPVTALWGDRDRMVPSAHRRGVLAAFPQADVQVWEGMGHHPLRERRDDLIDLVLGACSAPPSVAPSLAPAPAPSPARRRAYEALEPMLLPQAA